MHRASKIDHRHSLLKSSSSGDRIIQVMTSIKTALITSSLTCEGNRRPPRAPDALATAAVLVPKRGGHARKGRRDHGGAGRLCCSSACSRWALLALSPTRSLRSKRRSEVSRCGAKTRAGSACRARRSPQARRSAGFRPPKENEDSINSRLLPPSATAHATVRAAWPPAYRSEY
jgi:hypothetical protein